MGEETGFLRGCSGDDKGHRACTGRCPRAPRRRGRDRPALGRPRVLSSHRRGRSRCRGAARAFLGQVGRRLGTSRSDHYHLPPHPAEPRRRHGGPHHQHPLAGPAKKWHPMKTRGAAGRATQRRTSLSLGPEPGGPARLAGRPGAWRGGRPLAVPWPPSSGQGRLMVSRLSTLSGHARQADALLPLELALDRPGSRYLTWPRAAPYLLPATSPGLRGLSDSPARQAPVATLGWTCSGGT